MREIQAQSMKLSRVLTAWQGVLLYQRRVKEFQTRIEINRDKNIEKRFFNNWCKALTDNLRVLMTQRRRGGKLQSKALESFKLAVYLRKASNYAIRWRQENLKRAFLNQILMEIDRKTVQQEKVL